jgi:hypothetical protein
MLRTPGSPQITRPVALWMGMSAHSTSKLGLRCWKPLSKGCEIWRSGSSCLRLTRWQPAEGGPPHETHKVDVAEEGEEDEEAEELTATELTRAIQKDNEVWGSMWAACRADGGM